MALVLASILLSGCSSGNPFQRKLVSNSIESHAADSSLENRQSFPGRQLPKISSTSLKRSRELAKPSNKTKSPRSGSAAAQLAGFQQNNDAPSEGLIPTTVEASSNAFQPSFESNSTSGFKTQSRAGSYRTNDAKNRPVGTGPTSKNRPVGTGPTSKNWPVGTGPTSPIRFETTSSLSRAPNVSDPLQNPISLDQVLFRVAQCYPEIEIAIGEIETANGKVLASWGEFDRVVSGHSISQPLGFYQTYRNGVGLTQPLYGGGEVYGTYRIGDGNFEPWYGERETNEGGELKAGFALPFLKDRAIDERRAKLLAAGAQRDQVKSNVDSRLLQFQRFASQAYWDWVASGQAVLIRRQLLEFAETRVSGIKTRIELEDLAEIAQIDNDRLIAKRKNELIKARRSLEKSSIKLSIFWRDVNCEPLIPKEIQLPKTFPDGNPIAETQLLNDIETAFSVRPELLELQAMRQQASIDRRYAENLTLPKLDLKGFAGQDVGGGTSSKGDKTPFELQLGVFYEVPLERRKGLGKIQSADGKLTQIDAKIRFTGDKIRAELQDGWSAVNAAFDQIQQSTENVRLTKRSLNEFGKVAFDSGEIDLIKLNIYESAVATAELELLDAQYKYFFYQAVYETAKTGQAFKSLE